ncbi:hypothetical protein ANCDUO_07415 [Ancylostoma duodenale]|uniref:Ammonium transporter AmtB-like domain-containing protein n=1 Tax=Ancylostoma duodenale TaxID=51022 RepID=A0A0C2GM52_9BILA|nr:hypothetical protein ANCDUO_07415 [Ancylostoma duodenale]
MTTKLHNPEIQDDGVWMTASSFTIFTMTAGFGLLESGRVSSKDEVNVMVKNVVDVIFGGSWISVYCSNQQIVRGIRSKATQPPVDLI